jgi:hypothetical protein
MPVANFSRGCKQGCLGKVGGIGRASTKARMRAPAIVEIQVPAKPGARLGDAGRNSTYPSVRIWPTTSLTSSQQSSGGVYESGP